ncbi:MAG: D-alanyl-D-alanine carboxypeptidase [Firmicutes bacterium]|nr:D-alanyl-D-alanine carboxypeptidase [Bacillota bacterium]
MAISASAAILMDGPTGQILWAKNPDWQRPMASLTKIMTAALVLERCDLNDSVTVSLNAARTEGSSMYVRAGQTYRVEDLLHGLMLVSGNDCAAALAEYAGDSQEAFVNWMNRKAKLLGAENTRFANPHGLPAPDHYSTASDLALIARYALANPKFAEIVSSKQATYFDPASENPRTIQNKNRMLWDVEGADGVKTGYTLAAGRCLIASATREARRVIAVILDGPDMWEDAKTLLEYGLEAFSTRLVGRKGQEVGRAAVLKGLSPTTSAVLGEDLWVTLPIKAQIELEYLQGAPPTAPIIQWAPIGMLQIKHAGSVVAAAPVLAGQDIKSSGLKNYVSHFLSKVKELVRAN